MIDYNQIIAVGDIHGEFGQLGFRIKEQYQITNSIICLCGDIGMGFHKPNYYNTTLKKLNTIAKKGNNLILAVRGNHDDPSYFDGNYNFSHIKFVPDYYVYNVESLNKTILFIGGGISIDRTMRTINKTYWQNEMSIYNEDKLKDISPDIVITHSAPKFCEPTTKIGLDYWIQNDSKLIEDCDNERLVFTKVFNYLKENNNLPIYWCYGHYHRSWRNNIDKVNFKCCDCLEFYTMYQFDN